MNIEIAAVSCGDEVVRAEDVVLTRRLPDGTGTLTYLCSRCCSLVSLPLNLEEVMAAVFAGAKAIDIESLP